MGSWDPTCLAAKRPPQNRSNVVKNSIKTLKKWSTLKKKNSKIGNKWEIGIDIYILLNIKWITNRDLLIV